MPQAPYTLEQAEEDIATLRGQVEYLGEVGSGLNLNLSGAGGASFPATPVTVATLTDMATASVAANDPVAGAVYELDVWGSGVQASGARQTLQFGVTLGGQAMTNGTFGTTAFEAVSQAFRFRVTGRVICNTTGATGTWTSFLHATVADFGALAIAPANNNFATLFSCEAATTVTADTTIAETFTVQAAWGGTAGGPTLTSRVAVFKRIA